MSRVIFLLLILLLPLGAGCVTPYRAMPLEGNEPAHARRYHKDLEGITLAAELLERPDEIQARFHSPLEEQKIVPVVLHLENRGARTAVLRRQDFHLRLEDGTALDPLSPEEIIHEASMSNGWAWVGIPLIFPYYLLRNDIHEFNFDLQEDYTQKSLPGYLRTSPGDPAIARALFFRVPARDAPLLDRSPVLEVSAMVEALEGKDAHAPGKNVRFDLSLD